MKNLNLYLPLILLICILAIGCNNVEKPKEITFNYDSIGLNNELYLIQTDDRFGEWGGNTSLIRLYRMNEAPELQIDYWEYKGKVGLQAPPDPNSELKIDWFSGQPVLKQKLGILATNAELNLITMAIQELTIIKINNKPFPAMSGIVNRVMYSDSSYILEDYPSTNWEEFQSLKKKLLSD